MNRSRITKETLKELRGKLLAEQNAQNQFQNAPSETESLVDSEIDSKKESASGKNKIGTTQKGIGPTYTDKYARIAIKIQDLYSLLIRATL